MLAVYEKIQAYHPRDVDRSLYICTGTEYRVVEAVGSSERTRSSDTARTIDPELAVNRGIRCWADIWQCTLGRCLLQICDTATSPSPYLLDVAEALILTVNVALALTLANPVLYRIPVLYKSSKDSWGDGDTGIDLECTRPPETMSEIFSECVVSPSVEAGTRVKSRVRQRVCCFCPRLDSGT